MEQTKVDLFISNNSEKLPAEQLPAIREKLMTLDDNKWIVVSALQFKDPTTALILSLFLGAYGIDRFFIGHTGLGIGKLLTCGGCGIWAIIDWFNIRNATRNVNFQKLQSVLI
jgi:TM2 domain-containing membrane protein YozV